jgi:predicted Fe-Mo cluster-binding NifX family protein
MKLVITALGDTPESEVDPRFGRARTFILVDTETGTSRVVDNAQNLHAAQGAGIQAAQTLVDCGAEALITGDCGPKAFRALSAGGIRVYTAADLTVQEAVEALKDGRLKEAHQATVEGHWV